MNHVGKSGSRALFADDTNAVIIDLDENTVVETGSLSSLIASADWRSSF
jgi:hypothetical protein